MNPPSQFDPPRNAADTWLLAAGLIAVAAAALYLRTHQTDSPFTSADHIMIAYRTTCEPGWRWCFQNHYGPLQPLITKAYAHVVTGLGIPMTETLWRLPMGIVGAVIPILAFMLARRAGGTNNACWFAAIWTAVLPPLVTDARYMWAYETLGAALALAVMIATFAYMDRPTRREAWIAGILLAIYLQSHLHVYAVPCVVLLILLLDRSSHANDRVSRILRSPGIWLPPVISLCLMIAAWRFVGGGPIARIITKTATTAESPDRMAAALSLARAWLGHVGWPVAAVIGLMLVLPRIARVLTPGLASSVPAPRRTWFLVAWIVLFAAPLFIMGFRTGRPTQYLTQATMVLAILTPVVMFSRRRDDTSLPYWRPTVCMTAAAWLGAGAWDANFNAGRESRVTGVTAAWGAAVPNAGYKSAGWYVRKHVPPDAVVFALHDTSGLERPVAEYYLGRACIASEDLSAERVFAWFDRLKTHVDVIVDDLRVAGDRPESWVRDFTPVAEIRDGNRGLIRILTRSADQSPPLELQIDSGDHRFDIEFGPRNLGQPPPIPARMPDPALIRAALRK